MQPTAAVARPRTHAVAGSERWGVPTGPDRTLFEQHHALITEVIRAVVRRRRVPRREAEDFSADVMVRLLDAECRILRRFEGRGQLRTFLLRVVDRMLLDERVRHWGKWRPSAKARRLGRLAMLLERLTARDGLSFPEAAETLRTNFGVAESRDGLWRLYVQLPSRSARRFTSPEELEQVAAASFSPEERLCRNEPRHVRRVLSQAVARLPAEHRELIDLRFGRGVQVVRIARSRGLDQKALYRQYAAILRQLRQEFQRQGISRLDTASWGGPLADGPPAASILRFRR